jgi:hypothetical protein
VDEALDREVVEAVRRFVDRDVIPVASELEHNDEYPHALVAKMKDLGLFGATIPTQYGGLGLSFISYARIMAELSRGWMSLAGVINSHLIMAYVIANHGLEEQKRRTRAHRAARRQRRPIDSHQRRPQWRQLRARWHQDVHHQRAPRHDARRRRQNQSPSGAGLRGNQPVRGREE